MDISKKHCCSCVIGGGA